LPRTQPSKFFIVFLVAVAIAALALIPMDLFSPNLQTDQTSLRRPLISTVYAVIGVGGIIAVFYPNKCRTMFKKPVASTGLSRPSASTVEFEGHHPNCENYSANRITIRSWVLCAACSGLLMGAIAAITGVAAYSLGLFSLAGGSFWVCAVGEGLMLLGLVQIKTGGYVKFAVNALFAVGSAIVLIEADWAGQSLLVDVYVLGLTVFMLWIRILLSEYNNKRTCTSCGRCG
jgi:hypothetical protein